MDYRGLPTSESSRRRARVPGLVSGLAAFALIVTGCGSTTVSPVESVTTAASAAPASTEASASAAPSAAPTGGGETALIAQPDTGSMDNIELAPDDQRVDLEVPTFSDPTNVTNPLFPVSDQHSVLQLGSVEGEAFRAEVTLLPETRIVAWEGQQVEVLISQYVAYIGGRLHEVAYDLYAQADDGSVWYFGEDVFNFADGAIVDTHGTWLAGREGPAAMIMPADPQVGDAYRPENIPGFVFEEVVVKAVDQTADGPLGPRDGLLIIEEHHLDGVIEDKTFGPGYGEFFTGIDADTESLALAIPTDALPEPTPEELITLHDRAMDAFDAAAADDWDAAAQALDDLTAAWETIGAGEVPLPIEPIVTDALAALGGAIDGQDADAARQAAFGVAESALDLQLRHRSQLEVDLGRMVLWAARMVADAEAEELGAVNGDFFVIDYIRDRVAGGLADADILELNMQLEELGNPVGERDAAASAEGAQLLRETVEGFEPDA